MPRLTPSAIRKASATVAEATSSSADGVRLQHFGWLSDELVGCWADSWALTKDFGGFSAQMARVIVPLAPKAPHTLRPNSAVPAVYRVAARARKRIVQRWAESVSRPCLSARKGGGAVDQI